MDEYAESGEVLLEKDFFILHENGYVSINPDAVLHGLLPHKVAKYVLAAGGIPEFAIVEDTDSKTPNDELVVDTDDLAETFERESAQGTVHIIYDHLELEGRRVKRANDLHFSVSTAGVVYAGLRSMVDDFNSSLVESHNRRATHLASDLLSIIHFKPDD